MALASSVSRSTMVPVLASRYPAGGSIASVTSDSISAIDERSALNADSDSSRFDPWVGDDSGAGQQQHQQFRRMPKREMNSALLENSSESFVSAFASDANVSQMAGNFKSRVTQAALTHGIGTYVTTAAVIHDDVPSVGDNLSLKL
jgi:hypothetical protein